MKCLIAVLALLVPFAAVAQEHAVPAPVLRALAHDLAEMQGAVNASHSELLAAYASANHTVTVTDENAAIYSNANTTSSVVATPDVGDPLKVLGKTGDWLQVQPIKSGNADSSGWITSDAVGPMQSNAAMSTSTSEALFRKLTDMASQMRDEYRNNPYISIKGFDVEIGLVPSISLNFEFKK